MVAMISGWIKHIILIVLFASFLELLLPNSSLQRFIRVILGLMIMLAILNPAIDIVQGNWAWGDIPTISASSQRQADIINAVGKASEDRQRLTQELYKRELSKQIRAIVVAIDGVAETRVKIDLEEKPASGPNGTIKKVILYIKPGNVMKPGAVDTVSIARTSHPEMELQDRVRNKITTTLSELYQLPGEKITIQPWN